MIFNEGDPAKYLYFIKKGEVRISKRVFLKQDAPQYNYLELLEDPTIGKKGPKNTDNILA